MPDSSPCAGDSPAPPQQPAPRSARPIAGGAPARRADCARTRARAAAVAARQPAPAPSTRRPRRPPTTLRGKRDKPPPSGPQPVARCGRDLTLEAADCRRCVHVPARRRRIAALRPARLRRSPVHAHTPGIPVRSSRKPTHPVRHSVPVRRTRRLQRPEPAWPDRARPTHARRRVQPGDTAGTTTPAFAPAGARGRTRRMSPGRLGPGPARVRTAGAGSGRAPAAGRGRHPGCAPARRRCRHRSAARGRAWCWRRAPGRSRPASRRARRRWW